MDSIINYIKGAIVEMKKVTWPTKNEAKNYTILVIGISIAIAAFLGALDFIFTIGFEKFLNR